MGYRDGCSDPVGCVEGYFCSNYRGLGSPIDELNTDGEEEQPKVMTTGHLEVADLIAMNR